MRRDFSILMNGPDGCDAILTWNNPATGAIVDDVYGAVSGGVVSGSLTVRCHVNKMYGEGEIKAKHLVDVVAGDAIILFDNGVDLTGKNALNFAIQNMGTWRLVENPPAVYQNHARLNLGGDQLVQSCYMRRISTT